jgi:hypothetical protein
LNHRCSSLIGHHQSYSQIDHVVAHFNLALLIGHHSPGQIHQKR